MRKLQFSASTASRLLMQVVCGIRHLGKPGTRIISVNAALSPIRSRALSQIKRPTNVSLNSNTTSTPKGLIERPNIPLRSGSLHRRGAKGSDDGPLRAVHVAIQVKELCRSGRLDEAILYCTNVPAALQGPAAWNTIIHAAFEAKRNKLAYAQFLAMKKRAVTPTATTYHTLLAGYANSDSAPTPLQLEHAKKLYNDWVHLVLSESETGHGEKTKPRRPLQSHPAAAYIDVLSKAGAYQEIWDLFYDLRSEGPLAPDQYVFTSMFLAFAKRAGQQDVTTQRVRNAQDAKLLWRQMLRAMEKQPFPVDSHLVTAALRVLRGGGESEHRLIFDIIGNHLGLQLPDTPAPVQQIRYNIDPRALDAALEACRSANRLDLVEHYINILLHPESRSRARAITTSAMNHLLFSYAVSGQAYKAQKTIDWMLREGAFRDGFDVRPWSSSWALAFNACASAQNWGIAESLLARMRGPGPRSRWVAYPDAEATYFILLAARVSKPTSREIHLGQLQTALEIVELLSRSWLTPRKSLKQLLESHPTRADRRSEFQNRLADLVKKVLNEFPDLGGRWSALLWQTERIRTTPPKVATVPP